MANTKIGDIFSVKLDDTTKKYIQYVANDLTQLNSDVIMAFKRAYPIEATPDLSAVVKGEVEFYAHCVTKWGIKLKLWEKVGNISEVGKVDVLFRDSPDYGNPKIIISNNWYIWEINKPFKEVGQLIGENQKAEIGIIISPVHIVHRMRTGEYDFVYPKYQ